MSTRRRSTLEVTQIVDKVNRLLELPDSEHVNPEWRKGVAAVAEYVLHATGNYAGYNFVAWLEGGHAQWVADGSPQDTTPYLGDQTRRRYYAGTARPLGKGGAAVGLEYPLAWRRAS